MVAWWVFSVLVSIMCLSFDLKLVDEASVAEIRVAETFADARRFARRVSVIGGRWELVF